MKKASEYARHAQECRMLAAQMKTGEQREQLALPWHSVRLLQAEAGLAEGTS